MLRVELQFTLNIPPPHSPLFFPPLVLCGWGSLANKNSSDSCKPVGSVALIYLNKSHTSSGWRGS